MNQIYQLAVLLCALRRVSAPLRRLAQTLRLYELQLQCSISVSIVHVLAALRAQNTITVGKL